jgi:hypothetical protein
MTAKKTTKLSTDKKAELSTEDKKAKDVEGKDLESKTTELSTDKKAELSTYKIAEGSSITSKRGTLSPGVAISPADLSGGQVAFDNLVSLKKIVKS